jgi:hypothetical protein
MCTLVHLKKYSFVFVEKYIKFSTSNISYEKECFNCNVYFESNKATQVTYVQPSQDLSHILTVGIGVSRVRHVAEGRFLQATSAAITSVLYGMQ